MTEEVGLRQRKNNDELNEILGRKTNGPREWGIRRWCFQNNSALFLVLLLGMLGNREILSGVSKRKYYSL